MAMIEQWYTIGSFTFPASWGAIISSVILTFLFLFFWDRKASDWYSNGIFTFLLVWKLSVIVVDFQTVMKHPITILYFHGGVVGYWLGLIAALTYIFVKKVDHPSTIIISWMVTVLVFEAVLHMLHHHYLLAGIQVLLNLLITVFFIKKASDSGGDIWAGQLLVMFTLVQLFLSAFIGGFEFTVTTWTYLIMMTYLIFLLNIRRKHNE
ncbi:hypothetical protein [Rossellomorea sp. y25]|uniref:hypothetical protein n=1 Tax=Rossellomorea sp. y25 TaxID=3118174 RepID=UPI0026035CAB|nr:hypothetical protein [uncultured Rossellomorea sp.]